MLKKISTALRAVLYTTAFTCLWAWIALSLISPLDDRLGVTIPAWLAPVGWLLSAVGSVIVLACFYFLLSIGDGPPTIAPRRFVEVGPYRFVRNPMYLGGAALILGCGFSSGSLAASLFTLVVLGLAHGFVLLREETVLRREFGASYNRYCNTVNRWWPFAKAADESQPRAA